ncbi:uncharacterized protein LOC9658690 isoform X2 [Selaginella moellendorffii]|uniref:uncharacterized protein LOC9658690 isoform X2 n=1 Tax=Selaginella moellendorffii TaxID=88036 RepID=UPI000D1CDACA|nr:uncharacterized protein LOC9658690 isoform X2 [Selaginella moellendorffii]XP_024539365.1 uncharacterized protein LOC9658690 isoform X2 [Selaginella moellendorffii]|eukprot:XP_024539364.1 uncharacterized protein LOC9658690 isoform X2 [Selaginella moellendorffii]
MRPEKMYWEKTLSFWLCQGTSCTSKICWCGFESCGAKMYITGGCSTGRGAWSCGYRLFLGQARGRAFWPPSKWLSPFIAMACCCQSNKLWPALQAIVRRSSYRGTGYLDACSGKEELGTELLSKFKWGHGFLSLNSKLLKQYAKCKNSGEVVAVQNSWLSSSEKSEKSQEQDQEQSSDNDDELPPLHRNMNRVDSDEEPDTENETRDDENEDANKATKHISLQWQSLSVSEEDASKETKAPGHCS